MICNQSGGFAIRKLQIADCKSQIANRRLQIKKSCTPAAFFLVSLLLPFPDRIGEEQHQEAKGQGAYP